MRWASKPLPNNGDRRIVRRFAWLPKRMVDSGLTIWFCRYWVCQDWLTNQSGDAGWWYDKGSVEDERIAKRWRDHKQYYRTATQAANALK